MKHVEKEEWERGGKPKEKQEEIWSIIKSCENKIKIYLNYPLLNPTKQEVKKKSLQSTRIRRNEERVVKYEAKTRRDPIFYKILRKEKIESI